MLLNEFLLLGAVLFCIGVYGVHRPQQRRAGADVDRADPQRGQHQPRRLRRHARHASPARCSPCSSSPSPPPRSASGLAIVLLIYRNRRSVDLDERRE